MIRLLLPGQNGDITGYLTKNKKVDKSVDFRVFWNNLAKQTQYIINNDSIPWPYGDKLPVTSSLNINNEQLQKVVDNVLHETKSDGKSAFTRAVLIIYDGNIIAEKYAPGFDKNTVMHGKVSSTKYVPTASF